MPVNSPNMNLPVPTISVDQGPQWELSINACLALIDQHNHATGNGVPITPTGLSINQDLPFGDNNAILLRSVRWMPQTSPLSGALDLDCCYVSGVDLYYNDGNGNQIQITKFGGIAGTNGSIGGLAPPASVTYVSATPAYVFQSNASTSANLDAGSLVLRDNTANSKGITLNPPASLANNYSLTLPSALPSAQSFMTLDNSGNIAASIPVANGITRANLAAVGQQVSPSTGTFVTSATSPTNVPSLDLSITTTGRPVMVFMTSDGTGSASFFEVAGGGNEGFLIILRDSTEIYRSAIAVGSSGAPILIPPSSFLVLDTGAAAGGHTYFARVFNASGAGSIQINFTVLVAYEL